MKRYDYAEGLLGALSFVAWLGMAVGVATGLYLGFQAENIWLGIGIVAPTVVSGVTVLALAQVGHAIIDIALNSNASANWAEFQMSEERERRKAAQGQRDPSSLYRAPKPDPGGWSMKPLSGEGESR